jgi:hypothetical protein
LNSVFSRPGVGGGAAGGFAGGDYQRVFELPDGRRLWVFQDAFYSADDDVRDSLTAASRNAALVQSGRCWRVLSGPGVEFVGESLTVPLRRWFWLLDGEMGADGMLWVFAAEMANPNGTGAAFGAHPVGTWVARVDPVSLRVVSFGPARLPGPDLFGWSVVSAGRWSYLYSNCQALWTVSWFKSVTAPDERVCRMRLIWLTGSGGCSSRCSVLVGRVARSRRSTGVRW